MTAIDASTRELVRLLNLAINIAEKMKSNPANVLISEQAGSVVETLKGFRDIAISGKLPRPSKGEVPKGTGLGLTRGIGEWSEDDELLDAVFAVENHYKEFM